MFYRTSNVLLYRLIRWVWWHVLAEFVPKPVDNATSCDGQWYFTPCRYFPHFEPLLSSKSKVGGENCRKCSIFVRTISSAQFDSVSAMKISFDETIRYRLGLNSRQSFSLFKSLEFQISTGICMQIEAGDTEAEELICKSLEREVW